MNDAIITASKIINSLDINAQAALVERFQHTQERVQQAARTHQRNIEDITLIAVSKTQPLSAMMLAMTHGLIHFGENYAQELYDKASSLTSIQSALPAQDTQIHTPHWHFIGHLQKNKINKLIPFVHVYHTIDSIELLQALDKRLIRPTDCLIQINIDEEPQKAGIKEENLEPILESFTKTTHAKLRGLMTIPRLYTGTEKRPHGYSAYERMAQLKARIQPFFAQPLWLSMGMSHDFVEAIQHGATHIRIGRDLFGERSLNQPHR